MAYKDLAKQREAHARWASKNKERRREISRAYYARHREKELERQRQSRAVNPERYKDTYLRCTYGSEAPTHFKERMQIQQGLCDACGLPMEETPRLDHNHTTGQLRGLLHDDCNKTLGIMKENPEMLRKLADYLERWGKEAHAGI
jgi:site-specific DNA-cytosine methylase